MHKLWIRNAAKGQARTANITSKNMRVSCLFALKQLECTQVLNIWHTKIKSLEAITTVNSTKAIRVE